MMKKTCRHLFSHLISMKNLEWFIISSVTKLALLLKTLWSSKCFQSELLIMEQKTRRKECTRVELQTLTLNALLLMNTLQTLVMRTIPTLFNLSKLLEYATQSSQKRRMTNKATPILPTTPLLLMS